LAFFVDPPWLQPGSQSPIADVIPFLSAFPSHRFVCPSFDPFTFEVSLVCVHFNPDWLRSFFPFFLGLTLHFPFGLRTLPGSSPPPDPPEEVPPSFFLPGLLLVWPPLLPPLSVATEGSPLPPFSFFFPLIWKPIAFCSG